MKFLKIFILLFLFANLTANAQDELDALRYQTSTATGTARALGMGGAFSAVGADFTSASLNPAGLGLYRTSELAFTPTFKVITNDGELLGQNTSDTKSNFGFTNLSYVYNVGINNSGSLKSMSFGLGYNQIDNFHRNTYAQGYNDQNSIIDHFLSKTQGIPEENLSTMYTSNLWLAWYTYLTNTYSDTNLYWGAVENGNVQQTFTRYEKGRHNEWNFSLGLNLDDRVFVGLGLAIDDINYESEKIFEENDVNNIHQSLATDFYFKSLRYGEYYQTKGAGIRGNVGLIFRPNDAFRIGFSAKSPNYLTLNDVYYYYASHTGDSAIANGQLTVENQTDQGNFRYSIIGPYQLSGGIAVFLGKKGFISADVDYIDYASTKFQTQADYAFQEENLAIKQNFTQAVNYRIGAEFRANEFRFRAGYAYYGSPFKDQYNIATSSNGTDTKINTNRVVYSAGIGYRTKTYFIDLAVLNQQTTDKYALYSLPENSGIPPVLVNKTNMISVSTTFGLKF